METYGSNLLFMTSKDGEFVTRQRCYTSLNQFGGVEWNFTSVNESEWNQLGGGGPVATPEPISSALFLLGGAALAIKKRKAKV